MFEKIHTIIKTALGIAGLPDQRQKEILEKTAPALYQGIITRALEEMEEDDRNTFNEMMAKNPDPETMFTFLAEATPEIEDLAKEEAEKFKLEHVEIFPVA